MAVENAPLLAPAESQATVLPKNPHTQKWHWAQTALGIAATMGICYYGKEVLVVVLLAVLIAFVLAPIMDGLMHVHVPRGVAAGFAVLLIVASLGALIYISYNKADDLIQDLPKYTNRVKEEINQVSKRAESLEILGTTHEKGVLNVRQTANWTDLLTQGFGSAGTVLLAASFVPFLVYFMLMWQEHVRTSTVMLFPMHNRHTAYVTLGLISAMIRSFMVGNLIIAVFMGAISTVVFGFLHIPFFYFVGFVSGFLSLVPYLGVLLAIAPPVFVGIGHINSESLIAIVITVLGLHLISMNVLYPKFLGPRLQLNPLAVTLALLFWGWMWGAIGLLLAIPVTAAMKIIFDHVESLRAYGAWLGDE
jgi:predicted PurR-regulated permease PerM